MSEAKIGRTLAESTPCWPEPARPPKGAPNILVVLFDDVGFSDFGCYGSPIRTPTIDALAAEGLRYTGFHTTAMCSTTRAALLTGRNHHSVGMGCLANFDSGFPGYRGKIAREAGTLAEILRANGYGTYMVGKWHATPLSQTGAAGPYDGWPLGRGFNRYYGFMDAETDQFSPELVRDNTPVDPPGRYADGYHLTEDLVDESIRWITPVKTFMRSATEDVDFAGRQLAKGDWMMLCYASGNRDEEVFDDPAAFRIDRKPNKHLAFGYGAHLCLGQHLAKMEMRILWEELLPRLDRLELAGEPKQSHATFVNGPKTLPIRFAMH